MANFRTEYSEYQDGVSYLLPVKTPSPWLADCILSYINEGFEHKELIIVFNGDHDFNDLSKEFSEMLKNFDHSIFISNSTGIANALTIALESSKYKYVARVDADDLILPGRTQLQYSFLESKSNAQIAVVGGQVVVIDENGGTLFKQFYPTWKRIVALNFLFNCPIAHPAVMIRREILDDVGGYEIGEYAEDLSLWAKILEKHGITNITEQVLKYRLHSGQETIQNKSEIEFASQQIHFNIIDNLYRHKLFAGKKVNKTLHSWSNMVRRNHVLLSELEQLILKREARKILKYLFWHRKHQILGYLGMRVFIKVITKINFLLVKGKI